MLNVATLLAEIGVGMDVVRGLTETPAVTTFCRASVDL